MVQYRPLLDVEIYNKLDLCTKNFFSGLTVWNSQVEDIFVCAKTKTKQNQML